MVMLDPQRPFDTGDHGILVCRLALMTWEGIDGRWWILEEQCFNHNRTLSVELSKVSRWMSDYKLSLHLGKRKPYCLG